MKFIVILICVNLLTVFTTSAQSISLYHHRSSFLSSKQWFVIIDNDTAYVNWVTEEHWVKCGPIDTLYRQADGSYSTNNKVVSIKDNVLYRYIKDDNNRVIVRLKKAGPSSKRTWSRLYSSMLQNKNSSEDWASAVHVLYLKYVTIVNRG